MGVQQSWLSRSPCRHSDDTVNQSDPSEDDSEGSDQRDKRLGLCCMWSNCAKRRSARRLLLIKKAHLRSGLCPRGILKTH